jgi:hypothetical protein
MNVEILSLRFRAQAPLAALLLLIFANAAHGADTYNLMTKQLTMASVSIGSATYTNMVVTVGSIVSGPTGTTPNGSVDSYNPANGQLSVPSVMVGGAHYFNAVVTVGRLVSIGSVTGADTYSGTDLTIGFVKVGSLLADVVLAVTFGNVVSIAGGMPTAALDIYDGQTRELTIPAIQVNGRVYTNVTITVGAGDLVSAGSQACTSPCTITQPGTVSFTVPAGVLSVVVESWGGGGAGGAGAASVNTGSGSGTLFGGGGGGGAYVTQATSVVPGTTYTATVGAGGSSAAASGGPSSFSLAGATLVSAGGGQAGGAAAPSTGGASGTGGIAAGGQSGGNGEAGSDTVWFSGNSCAGVGGNGGNGANGGAGGIDSGSSESCFLGGTLPVAPGGGGEGGNAGGGAIGFNGAPGQITVIWSGGGAAKLGGS